MDDQQIEKWETFLRSTAAEFPYPQTPDYAVRFKDIASVVKADQKRMRSRLLTRAGVIAAALMLVLLSVPSVRAAVIDFIQVGVVRIFYRENTPTPMLDDRDDQITLTVPTSTIEYTLLDMPGETTLEEVASQVSFQILVPTYPQGLRNPDRVYVPYKDKDAVIFLWLEHGNGELVRMSLMQFGFGVSIGKEISNQATQTYVNNEPAVWIEEPHTLLMDIQIDQQVDIPFYIQGGVLIWKEGEITYRLGTNSTLSEALRTAESLVTIP